MKSTLSVKIALEAKIWRIKKHSWYRKICLLVPMSLHFCYCQHFSLLKFWIFVENKCLCLTSKFSWGVLSGTFVIRSNFQTATFKEKLHRKCFLMAFTTFCRTILSRIFSINSYKRKKLNEKGHKSHLINTGIWISYCRNGLHIFYGTE